MHAKKLLFSPGGGRRVWACALAALTLASPALVRAHDPRTAEVESGVVVHPHPGGSHGTLGLCFVHRGTRYLLGNYHVLVPPSGARPLALAAPRGAPRAELAAWHQPRLGDDNAWDLAVARLLPGAVPVPRFRSGAGLVVPYPRRFADGVDPRKRYALIGARSAGTGRFYGTLPEVQVDLHGDGRLFRFRDQLAFVGDDGPLSRRGDSGAVIVELDSGDVVALAFGVTQLGRALLTVANPLYRYGWKVVGTDPRGLPVVEGSLPPDGPR